jgi:hypothetical protein
MKCPHCLENFFENRVGIFIAPDIEGDWFVVMTLCPACKKLVLYLRNSNSDAHHPQTRIVQQWMGAKSEVLFRPRGSSRPPCPVEVPPNLAGDYLEACLVLPDSAKAAAALGRRCLQNLLRDTVKVTHGNLSDEIQQVLDSGKLPSSLHESIDAIRNIGNFAAHSMKSTQTGMILDVEPGEAEWTLDVLEELFDFYFVRPAVIKKKKDAFNQKLQEAGKPPMK